MLHSTTRHLTAVMLTAVLGGFAQPAYPETGNACVDAAAELRHHLAANDAAERLEAVQGFMAKAVKASGHVPHKLAGELFAAPLAVAQAQTATQSLLPKSTPMEPTSLRESPLDAVLERLDRIHGQLDTALAGVTDEQADRFRNLLPDLLERTSSGSDLEDIEHGRILVEIQAAIDRSALEKTAALLAGLAQPEVAASLAERFRGEPVDTTPAWLDGHVAGDIIRSIQTEHGAVIVGGPGTNIYTGPAALIIDTGGDDVYALPSGDPVRIIIDLEGHDNYTGHADGALAGRVLGASLIADHAGNDTYAGGRIAQGAAVAGVGILHDLGGDDQYFAAELAQGASLAGIGALVDAAGNDLYSAAKFAQGYGGALGIGILVDESGNDAYLAGNKHPSSYGVPGNHQAFSQGVGMGFRNDIAGGIGLLRDRGGDDRYIAGNCSQGAGYYLGAGLLIDERGNDNYAGGRYTQGAAAHLGIGLLRDEAGNDTYIGSASASQGGAWDQSIAALIDCAGDDNYTANEFGLAAAAQNAIAFFIDDAGKDEFTAQRNVQGHSGPVDYHDGGKRIGNLAVFIFQEQTRIDANRGSRVHRRSSIEFGRDRIPLPQNTGVRDVAPGGEHLDARSESGMTEKDGPSMTKKTTVIPGTRLESGTATRTNVIPGLTGNLVEQPSGENRTPPSSTETAAGGGERLDARSESGMTGKEGPGTAEKDGPGMTEKTTVIPNWMTERSRARRKEQPSFPARPGIQPNDHR